MSNQSYRFEFKYLIKKKELESIKKDLPERILFRDKHATGLDGSYIVNSLYFDSFKYSDYLDKISGEIKRKKIRLRIYSNELENAKFVNFEIKHKYDMMNRKTKVKLSPEEASKFIENGAIFFAKRNWGEMEKKIKNRILFFLIREPVKPIVSVVYSKNAYMTTDKSIRVTLDSGIQTCRNNILNTKQFMTSVSGDEAVLEIKFQHILPFWFKKIIYKYNLQRDTYSKYEKSLEALHVFNPLLR